MNASRRIVLTGATRGLGRAMARKLASLGHRVYGCGRSRQDLASLGQLLGEGHPVRRVDVTSSTEVNGWANSVLEDGGAPDLVLNNAGLINRLAPLWEVPEEEVSQVIDVNIKGVIHIIRAFLPAMIERGSGVVVNFSSGWGQTTAPQVAPYCATKFAIEGLTGALAQELPSGLAAVPLSPGIIQTDMLETAFGEGAESYWTPQEWVETAVPYILGLGPQDNGVSQRVPGS